MRKSQLLITACFFAIALFHFLTLDISPIVKQDETSFNAVTIDYIQHGTYYMSDCPLIWDGEQFLMYGPVYFWMQSKIITRLGNGVYQFRILGVTAGLFLLLLISIFFFRFYIKGSNFLALLLFGLLLDPFFIAAMHSGRMDTLGLLFVFAAYLLLLRAIRLSKQNYPFVILSSLCLTLACLTSARFMMFLVPAALVFLKEFFLRKEWRKTVAMSGLLYFLVAGLVYYLWIVFGFGGLENYFLYAHKINDSISFVGLNSLFIPYEEYPLIFVSVLFLLSVAKDWRFFIKNETILFLIPLLLFYATVKDKGPHSAAILPFYYLFIALAFTHLSKGNRLMQKSGRYLIGALVLFNLSVFFIKSFVLVQSSSSRKPEIAEIFFKKHVPRGSRVVGDFMYHYAAIKNDCGFRYLYHEIKPIEQIEKDRRANFNYEYLMISDQSLKLNPKAAEQYFKNSQLQTVAALENTPQNYFSILKILKLKNYTFGADGYSGKLYKRISSEQK